VFQLIKHSFYRHNLHISARSHTYMYTQIHTYLHVRTYMPTYMYVHAHGYIRGKCPEKMP